jgi:hypothetical protein
MQIQAYLTAAAINLKRLAAWIASLLCALSALVVATAGKHRPTIFCRDRFRQIK